MSPPESDAMTWLEDKTISDKFILSRFDDLIALTSNDASVQAQLQLHYATVKHQQFWRYGRLDDLAEAVEKGSQALTNTTDSDPEYADRLVHLGAILHSRYGRVGSMHDLETAIQLSRLAVEVTLSDHPNLAGRLNNLEHQLQSRFERTGRMEDLQEAIQTALRAVEITPLTIPT